MSDYGFDTLFEPEPVEPAPTVSGPLGLVGVLDEQAAVWSDTLGHADPPVGDRGRPYWRASALGYCLRRQCLWRAGLDPTRYESPKAEADKVRRFAWGNDLHSHVATRVELAGLLVGAEVSLHDEALAIDGHVDLLWGGHVQAELPTRARYWAADYTWAVRELRGRLMAALGGGEVPVTITEVKTVGAYGFAEAKQRPRFDYRMQLASYALMARRNPGQLPTLEVPQRFTILVLSRDSVEPVEFPMPPEDPAEALDRVGRLNDAWATGTWPPCTCGLTDGLAWEARYCPYVPADGDASACCGMDLLARLEASLGGAR